jgi:hypothetical protein
LCAGTPCIYYGTEQGFNGTGGDNDVREAMFDQAVVGRSLLNPDCVIYQEIAKIAAVMRTTPALRFGRMYFRQISGDAVHFGLPYGTDYTLAFSRIVYGTEVLVAYNISDQPRNDFVIVDNSLHKIGDALSLLFEGSGNVPVQQSPDGTTFAQVTARSASICSFAINSDWQDGNVQLIPNAVKSIIVTRMQNGRKYVIWRTYNRCHCGKMRFGFQWRLKASQHAANGRH